MFMFKKRKKESIAIPFLLSMFFTLIIVGIPVSKYYNHLIAVNYASNTDNSNEKFIPDESNNATLLFAFNNEDPGLRDSFMIVRSIATEQRLIFIPVSNDIVLEGRKMSDIYNTGGIIELNKAVEKSFEIKIDRYVDLSRESLGLLTDVLGGVNYNVPKGLKGINEGTQFLSSDLLITLISNKKLPEDKRTVTLGSVISDMFKQTNGERVVDCFDYTFNKLVNIVGSGTNITSIDYASQKRAMEYIFDVSKVNAAFKIPTCSETKEGLVLDKSALKELKENIGVS